MNAIGSESQVPGVYLYKIVWRHCLVFLLKPPIKPTQKAEGNILREVYKDTSDIH